MTVFRQVIPNSALTARNEAYEYYLIWLSPSGGVRNWMFSHTDGEEETAYDSFVIEGLTDIRSIPKQKRKTAKVIARSLTAEHFDYVSSIAESNRIYQVKKDGTRIPVAVGSIDIPRGNQLKEFSVRLELIFKEQDILNV